ncbi:MAG: exonuclease domain-containing protein [Faecousia sp.]
MNTTEIRVKNMESIIALPNDYVVIDLETTGFDYNWDDIIEMAAIRYRDGIEVQRYEQLIEVGYSLPNFITELTGISNEMLSGCPHIEEAIHVFSQFIGDDIIIGHNVSFDMRFLNKAYRTYLDKSIDNSYVDTMRISRKLFPNWEHHRLSDLAEHYGLSHEHSHRSAVDCDITNRCYRNMREAILVQDTEEGFIKRFTYHSHRVKASDINASTDEFNPDHPLYHKNIVFTGALSQMTRAEAMQLVANCGGICGNGVTKETNYLVVGTSDFISATEGKKTAKIIKAEKMMAQGYDIALISEATFFDYISIRNS